MCRIRWLTERRAKDLSDLCATNPEFLIATRRFLLVSAVPPCPPCPDELQHDATEPQLKADASPRCALQKLDELLVSVEQFRPSGPEGVLTAFCPPERPQHYRLLIPGGDREISRGQRPRKTRPQQGPTLKGSNPGGATVVLRRAAQGNATPSGSGSERRAFRRCCPRLLSCALAGHEKPTLLVVA